MILGLNFDQFWTDSLFGRTLLNKFVEDFLLFSQNLPFRLYPGHSLSSLDDLRDRVLPLHFSSHTFGQFTEMLGQITSTISCWQINTWVQFLQSQLEMVVKFFFSVLLCRLRNWMKRLQWLLIGMSPAFNLLPLLAKIDHLRCDVEIAEFLRQSLVLLKDELNLREFPKVGETYKVILNRTWNFSQRNFRTDFEGLFFLQN